MCCLNNEQDTYEYLNDHLPEVGDTVTVIDGYKGEVHSVSVLRQKIKVIITDDKGDKEIREYKAEEVKFKPRKRRERVELSKEELKALKDLEKDEGESKL